MKSINDILKYGESYLCGSTPDYLIDAKLLLEHVLECDGLYLFMHKQDEIISENIVNYKLLLDRRKTGEPLQYIVGHQEFMGLEFDVAPGVLIPRGDTEPLVEAIIERVGDAKRILDIGAGSGAIHISLAHYLKHVECVSVDISDEALKIAQKNAVKLKVSDRITYFKSDVFEALKGQKFDVIVSNPPYIPTKVIEGLQKELMHEPKIALDGGEDGYDFYRRIILESKLYFNANGLLAFEVGHDQSKQIVSLLEEAGYKNIEIISDLGQIERVVMARYERL